MRDNYVGDVGDFFKYGLLRTLCGETSNDNLPQLQLGVVWYLYPDPCKVGDGLHLDYLTGKNKDGFHANDPKLHDKLRKLIESNNRIVQEVRKQDILPHGTLFYESPLSFSTLPKGTSLALKQRLNHRLRWLQGALQITENADIIFFDPDNGLEVKSTAKHHDRAPKFTFYDELLPFWQRGQALVIYQHKNMHESAEQQIRVRIGELKKALPNVVLAEAVYFPSYGGRIFFILANNKYDSVLGQRVAWFQKLWNSYIKSNFRY